MGGVEAGGSAGSGFGLVRVSLRARDSFWRQESISAETQAAPGKTAPHCLKGKFVVITIDR